MLIFALCLIMLLCRAAASSRHAAAMTPDLSLCRFRAEELKDMRCRMP